MRAVWGAVLALAACAEPDVTPVTSATRVVALVPAATEIIAALGKSDVLVGRAHEDTARYAAHLPAAGSVLEPSTERVIALQPGLVIAWPGAHAMLEHMRGLGVRTLAVRFERVADITANTREIGRLLGVAGRADSLAQHISSGLARLQQENADRDRPTVLFLLDTEPLWTAGPNTFVDDLIQIAGGTNSFADLPVPWSEVSLEAVIARQPDVIIVAKPRAIAGARDGLADSGWRRLHAVRNHRVYSAASDDFNRPGANVVATARRLTTILHPGSHP